MNEVYFCSGCARPIEGEPLEVESKCLSTMCDHEDPAKCVKKMSYSHDKDECFEKAIEVVRGKEKQQDC